MFSIIGDVSPYMHHSHAEKARINSRDTIADALEASYSSLKGKFKLNDVDQDIKVNDFLPLSLYPFSVLSFTRGLMSLTTSSFWYELLF